MPPSVVGWTDGLQTERLADIPPFVIDTQQPDASVSGKGIHTVSPALYRNSAWGVWQLSDGMMVMSSSRESLSALITPMMERQMASEPSRCETRV